MGMQSTDEAKRAAHELVDRLGRGGAGVYLRERLDKLAGAGDWSGHDAALRVLTALERAAAS